MARPMLDDLELQQVQTIELDGDQVWVQHDIPALEGDFLQGLGRRASQITLTGVLSGAEVADGLKNLRDKFRAAQPVSFVADIATATRLEQMLIEEMGVRELAGKPSRYEYAFTLREYIPATPPEVIIPPPPPPPPPPPVLESTLEVQVIVDGQPEFDHSRTRVLVEGTTDEGQFINPEFTNRQGNVWTETPFPPGNNYTATATTVNGLTGSGSSSLPVGQSRRIIIHLREGRAIAHAFVIHYWFDKAFVEPCMRDVLKKVVEYAGQHPDEKLVIVGHTDESGSPQYNQSLSERRARGAYAYLTFGRSSEDADAAVAEWNELRRTRTTGVTHTINDTWGPRQYQSMLQDLGFYKGPITDTHDPATDQAVRDFQTANGLTVDGDVGDQTWPVLIRAYMAQDNLAIPETQFMSNAKDGCDEGVVQWIGCGEKMPKDSTPRGEPPDRPCGPQGGCAEPAWRPNRRTDLLFVNDSSFPCEDIPQPVTLDIKTSDKNPSGWCLGTNQGSAPTNPCCFMTFDANKETLWLVQPAEPDTFVVNGRVQFADGSPAAGIEYVLIAPDGEFMNGETVCQVTNRRKGTPYPGQTDADGRLTDCDGNVGYPGNQKRVGTYTLELTLAPPLVARLAEDPPQAAKGAIVCKQLDGSSEFTVVIGPPGAAVGTTLKGKLFWNRTWDYNTAPQLPATAVTPPVQEFLPGAKVELYVQQPGDPDLTLFQTIFLSTADLVTNPHGAFEFTGVPPAQRAALRVLLEHRDAQVVVIKGQSNAVDEPDFKVENGQVIWHQFDIDASQWNQTTPEVDLGEIEITRDHFIDLCDAYKSIWFGHRRLKALAEFDVALCQVNYPEPPSSTSFEQNQQLFIKKDDLKDRDVLLHEYGHFIMDVIGRLPPHPGYLYNDSPGHSRDSKEHYEASWFEGAATFLSCALQDEPRYHDGYDTNFTFNLETDNTTIGPHAEGSIQEALWRIYKIHGTSFKDGFWKALTDSSIRPQINTVFDFFNNWKDLGLADLDKLFESFQRFNMEFGYEYLDGAGMFTAVAPPDGFDAAAQEFQTIDELFNNFGHA